MTEGKLGISSESTEVEFIKIDGKEGVHLDKIRQIPCRGAAAGAFQRYPDQFEALC